jgi:hypothetical protein
VGEGGERLVVWHRAASRAEDRGVGLAAWAKAVAARFAAAGGVVEAAVSAVVVASFPSSDVGDAVDIVLDLLDEADEAGIAASFGVGLSAVRDESGLAMGAAFESAESLAVRAHEGEVLLDAAARDRARGLFLFARTVGGGAQAQRAASIDRSFPRRDASSAAMAKLGAPVLAPATAALLPTLTATLSWPEPALVLLRGPVGAGAVELVGAAHDALKPEVVVQLAASGAGPTPLGSVRIALAHDPGGAALLAKLDLAERAPLDAVLRGEVPPLDAVLAPLVTAIDRVAGLPWVVLSPLAAVDGASLDLVLALQRARPRVAVIGRKGVDTPLASALEDHAERVELTLPPLRTADARVVAQAILGEHTHPDVARRVAVLGGDTPLGVLEAARTMIGAGDLVLDPSSIDVPRFTWRGTPRGGARAIALDALVAERLEQLDGETRRVLELCCVTHDGIPRAELERIALADGLRGRAVPRALERLAREGWIAQGETIRPASSFVRRFVLSASPPSRVAELHRFAAAAIPDDAGEARLTERALHLAQGAPDAAIGETLVDVAERMQARGYPSSAVQLADAALRAGATGVAQQRAEELVELGAPRVEEDTSNAIFLGMPMSSAGLLAAPAPEAERASEGSEPPLVADPPTVDMPLPPDATPAPDGDDDPDVMVELRDAIRRRDLEGLDRLAERAIAEGSDMNAVARIRALAAALRGDLAGAEKRLERARKKDAPRDRRALLAEAMVALRAGRGSRAVRLALRALADARRAQDERGEAVALFTMAACFRAAGRANDAALLEARVDA